MERRDRRAYEKLIAQLRKRAERADHQLANALEGQRDQHRWWHWKRLLGSKISGWVGGAIIGLFAQDVVLPLIPSPPLRVTIQGLTGAPPGCTNYYATLHAAMPIEHFDVSLEFPNRIDSSAIGFPVRKPEDPNIVSQGLNASKDSNGKCILNDLKYVKSVVEVQTAVVGNTVTFAASDLPEGTVVMAVFAVNDNASDVEQKYARKLFRGSYVYTKLTRPVRKPVQFIDRGLAHHKPRSPR